MRTRMGLTSQAITVDSEVGALSGGEKQGVAIARALYFDADLIILDEPTMGLSITETERVLNFTRSIREQRQVGDLHRPQHLSRLRRGRPLHHPRPRPHRRALPKSEVTREKLVETMVALHDAGELT